MKLTRMCCRFRLHCASAVTMRGVEGGAEQSSGGDDTVSTPYPHTVRLEEFVRHRDRWKSQIDLKCSGQSEGKAVSADELDASTE